MIRSDLRPYVWMLSGSFSFSLMAVLTESLTRRSGPELAPLCDWQTVAMFRAGLVATFAALLARQAGATLVWFRPARLWLRSVAGSLSMVCAFYAFGHMHSEDVVTLSNTFPLWVAVLSWPLYRQPPGSGTVAAILVGVVGVILVEQPHLESGNWGAMAALAAAGLTAVAMLGLNRLRDIDPRAVVVHFSVVATLFCGAAFLFTDRTQPFDRVLELSVAVKLLGIGVAATVGQVFLTLAFGQGAPAKVSVVGLTQIVFVTAMCVVVFDRPVNTVALIGTALIIAPTAWLITRSRSAKASPGESSTRPPKLDPKVESLSTTIPVALRP